MDRTLITWSVANLLTIWLMFILGFLLLGLGSQTWKRYAGASSQGGA